MNDIERFMEKDKKQEQAKVQKSPTASLSGVSDMQTAIDITSQLGFEEVEIHGSMVFIDSELELKITMKQPDMELEEKLVDWISTITQIRDGDLDRNDPEAQSSIEEQNEWENEIEREFDRAFNPGTITVDADYPTMVVTDIQDQVRDIKVTVEMAK